MNDDDGKSPAILKLREKYTQPSQVGNERQSYTQFDDEEDMGQSLPYTAEEALE